MSGNLTRVALAAAALALAPAAAQATTTFGADLNRPANATFDCTVVWTPVLVVPSNAQTCTWSTVTSLLGTTRESSVVPVGNGTVTRVRVRVGATPGPMRVEVLRALRQPNAPPTAGAACCKLVGQSAVFTPAANGITTIDVNLPVRHDQTPDPASGLYNFDQLALSVLAPGVPIPAHMTGQYDGTGPMNNVYWPAWQGVGQERADGGGSSGMVVLMSADWEPTAQAPPTPTPTPPPLPAPTPTQPATKPGLTLAQSTARVRDNAALVRLKCALTQACLGSVRLLSRAPTAGQTAAATRPGVTVYGTARVRIAGGSTGTVRVALSRRGRALLRDRGPDRVWAVFTLSGASAAIPAAKLSLTR